MLSSLNAKRVTPRLSLQTSYKSVVFTAAHAILSIVLTVATLSLLFSVLEALPIESNSHKQDALKLQTFLCLLVPLVILYYSQIVALMRLHKRTKPQADVALRNIFVGHSHNCALIHYLNLSSSSLALACQNNTGGITD
jgi:hypothetical protein